jgi:hypothetical protein
MDTPNTPREPPESADLEAGLHAWLELKREMESLHVQVEYVRLMSRWASVSHEKRAAKARIH